jgi:isopenicillin N synthase-like dioxygenase
MFFIYFFRGELASARLCLDTLAKLLLRRLCRYPDLSMNQNTVGALLENYPPHMGAVTASEFDAFHYQAAPSRQHSAPSREHSAPLREHSAPFREHSVYGAAAHVDKGLLTLVLADTPNGLQLQTVLLHVAVFCCILLYSAVFCCILPSYRV